MLPHRFPFRLVDRVEGGRVRVALTTDAVWLRGSEGYPAALAVEILAQSAILLLPETTSGGGKGLLAGIDGAAFHASPAPGDVLSIEIRQTGRFGTVVRVEGTITRRSGRGDEEEPVAEAALLLARVD